MTILIITTMLNKLLALPEPSNLKKRLMTLDFNDGKRH